MNQLFCLDKEKEELSFYRFNSVYYIDKNTLDTFGRFNIGITIKRN
jgi:hypothetical protein